MPLCEKTKAMMSVAAAQRPPISAQISEIVFLRMVTLRAKCRKVNIMPLCSGFNGSSFPILCWVLKFVLCSNSSVYLVMPVVSSLKYRGRRSILVYVLAPWINTLVAVI